MIQGDAVRLVLPPTIEPSADKLFPDEENVSIDAVPPRFEDGFIAMLRERRGCRREHAATSSAASANGKAEAVERDGRVIEVHDVQRRFRRFLRGERRFV